MVQYGADVDGTDGADGVDGDGTNGANGADGANVRWAHRPADAPRGTVSWRSPCSRDDDVTVRMSAPQQARLNAGGFRVSSASQVCD